MTDYHRIAAAIAYVQAHFQAQPDLEEVARQAQWSPFHFQRKFGALGWRVTRYFCFTRFSYFISRLSRRILESCRWIPPGKSSSH